MSIVDETVNTQPIYAKSIMNSKQDPRPNSTEPLINHALSSANSFEDRLVEENDAERKIQDTIHPTNDLPVPSIDSTPKIVDKDLETNSNSRAELPTVTSPYVEASNTIRTISKYNCEMLIKNEHVGRIIGRGGQTIRDIQMRSGAILKVPQDSEPGEPNRKIKIYGTKEQVQDCKVLVKLYLPSSDKDEINRLQAELRKLDIGNDTAYKKLTIKTVEVPMEHVGRVIGKGGVYTRLIQSQTGATVTLPRFTVPGSDKQIFTITGVFAYHLSILFIYANS